MSRTPRSLRGTLVVVGLTALLAHVALAGPTVLIKHFPIPTPNSSPKSIVLGADGNFWFTEGFVNPPQPEGHKIGRITRRGEITEFLVCSFCFPNDIVQGPRGILYFTKSDPALGRISVSGQVLPDVPMPSSLANGNGIAAHGDDIWIAAFNTNSIWRFHVPTRQFTEFPVPTPAANPYDVAVDADGIVWFTEFHANKIGRLDPESGVITETALQGGPRQIAIAADGTVWFTERFTNAVGYLDPTTNQVMEFALSPGAGPEGIAAAGDGSVWFTQSSRGNVARITADGLITEVGPPLALSEPFGITVAPNGNPWYVELGANSIAVVRLPR